MHRQSIQHSSRHRGAALITSILLLLVLTIIGVTAMQMIRMQERMAGNSRDLNLAFQGAEAALRNGEALIAAQPGPPDTCSASPCKFWQANLPALVNPAAEDATWWSEHGTQFEANGDFDTPTHELEDLKEDPRFVVEFVTHVSDTLTVGEGGSVPPGRDFYKVTARSSGASDKVNTVLQTTYARR